MQKDERSRRVSRREFIRGSAALLAASGSVPAFLARTASAFGGSVPRNDRILIVIQLTGGNDGLNTVAPTRDDAYYRNRPTLAVGRGDALRVADGIGLHPQLSGLKSLFDDGMLSIVQNVGYPNPDRSHFSAMDIWHAADPTLRHTQTGWLGRAADLCDHAAPWAIHLDDDAMPAALRTQRSPIPSVRDLGSLRLSDGPGGRAATDAIMTSLSAPRANASDTLLFVQRAAVSACSNARRLEQLSVDPAAPYPAYGLAHRLGQIAALIAADVGARVYYTSLGGFDTHAKQLASHGALLRELGDSIAALMNDLRQRQLADRVLVMTFSEFGRRVKENGSGGTDHGAAAPMFIAGPGCKPGIVGTPPNLSDLLEGDVRHEIDFRQVYATLLADHLGVPSAKVLHGRFEKLPLLRA